MNLHHILLICLAGLYILVRTFYLICDVGFAKFLALTMSSLIEPTSNLACARKGT